MEVRILGPLDICADGAPVAIRRGIPRLILTVLILRRGTTVSADALCEWIWGDDQPANPANALHTQISHLRRALRPLAVDGAPVLVTDAGGYRLDVPREAVDAARFEDLVVAARTVAHSDDPAELTHADGLLTAALAMWYGEPLADTAGHPYLVADTMRLTELRLEALEASGQVMLALGRHADLVPDVRRTLADHPLHEPFHAQLVLALYRSGRQVDALRAAAHARRLLAEEVGVDPGPELKVLEQQVLAHAPELDWIPRDATRRSGQPAAAQADEPAGPHDEARPIGPEHGSPPPLGRHHVVRPRLDELLDGALDAALTIVSAPAGSGKTTALAGWFTRRDGPGGWVTLEPSANDPSVFWPAVAAALRLPGAAGVRSGRSLSAALDDQAGPDGPVVVLDDYHLITNPAIHDEMDGWLATDGDVHVVIGTRHDPPLRLAGLRAHGRLREVRFDELRFAVDELDQVLDHALGLRLPSDELAQLADRTEGWAAAIQLAAVSLQHHQDPHAFVRDFAGDDRHIADFLRDEVLARVDGELQAFLLDTAILDRLDASLCEAVTGIAGAQRHLEELERRNLFLQPLDHRRQWYRYHALFAEWLRLHPRQGVEERHRRAARWLGDHGLPGDAIRHHLAAGDAEDAARLIERERWVLVGQGRQQTLQDWIRLLPGAALRSRPRLTVAAAWIAYHAGHWDDVDRLIRLVDPAAVGDDHEAPLLRAELALLTAGRLAALGRLDGAGELATDALAPIPRHEPRARSGLLLVLGKSRLAAGDLDGARESFGEAVWLAEPYGLTIVEVIARSHLAEIARLDGRPAEAEQMARDALAVAGSADLADHPECTVAHLTLANLLIDAGRPDEAELELARADELARSVPYEPRERALAATRERVAGTARPTRVDTPDDRLTAREQAVLRLLPSDLTPREIAAELYVSLNTVKTHTRSLYRKLGVQHRHAAVEQARHRHLL